MDPAMDSNVGDELPHAYVQFVGDEEKEAVPLAFIKKFPSDWREKGWDKSKLFHVFWSPEDDETPVTMLDYVAKIPEFESGTVQAKGGYYRASVLLVEGSKNDLEEKIAKKRVSVSMLKYMHSSFDAGTSGNQANVKPNKESSRAGGKKSSSTSGKKKPSKPKGVNKSANTTNTSELKADLQQRFPNLHQQQSTRGGGLPGRKRCRSRHGLDSESSDDSCHVVIQGKEEEVDPNYTPAKYLKLQQTLTLAESRLKKSYEHNMELKEKVTDLQQKLIAALEKGCPSCDDKKTMDTSGHGDFKNSEKNLKSVEHTSADMSWVNKYLSLDQGQMVSASEFCEAQLTEKEEDSEEKKEPFMKVVKEEPKAESGSTNVFHTSSKQGKEQGADEHVAFKSGDEATKMSVGENSSVKKEKQTFKTGGKEFELCTGVVLAPDVWHTIFSLPSGPKKDNQFVKDLTTAAYGPEVLAASSILGTLKGQKRSKEDRTKKPALEKEILKAVREKLIERVIKDEKLNRETIEVDVHPRTSIKFFHEAIRGAQKRMIGLGYGKGVKKNDVSTDILMAAPKKP